MISSYKAVLPFCSSPPVPPPGGSERSAVPGAAAARPPATCSSGVGIRLGMGMGRGSCGPAGLWFLSVVLRPRGSKQAPYLQKFGRRLREEERRERVSQGETREWRSVQLQVSRGRRENSPVLSPLVQHFLFVSLSDR